MADIEHVQGLDAMEEALKVFEPKQALSMQRRALRKAAQQMKAAAENNVKYDLYDPDGPDGYHVKDHIAIQLEPARSRSTPTQFRVGVGRRTAPSGSLYAIEGGLSKGINAPNYALILEEDSPYLRPAFDSTVESVIADFRTELAKAIERALKRQAKVASKFQ